MNEVEFLPAWYHRRQRNRARLIIGAGVAGVVLLIVGVAWMFN